MQMSESSMSFDSFAPVRAMVCRPFAFAVIVAMTALREFPDVEIAIRISGFSPYPMTCWAKPKAGSLSLL